MRDARRLRLFRAVVLALVAGLFAAGAMVAHAYAQEDTAEAPGGANISAAELDLLWDALAAGPVFEQKCQNRLCHANLITADKKRDQVSEIIFSHGIHRGQFDCSACHARFPHAYGETELPEMVECFACHGLRHGPVGLVAYDSCESCHRTPRDRLRPSFHTPDWAEEPHVEPSLKELQTSCMMCHDGPFCDDCHEAEYVRWKPEQEYRFDPGVEGCMQCHAQASLVRAGPGGTATYRVDGLEKSAHNNLTCVQCHADFRWDDKPGATPLWNVNAGLACMDCHEHAEAAERYRGSIHWEKLQAREFGSASCGSCHGGHNIKRLDTAEASRALHASAVEMCARCHMDYYESYDDYYHGAAYKRGTPDAPACWDCHDSHALLPSKNPSSSVSPGNVAATCGREGCHRDTSDEFVEASRSLIHRKDAVASANPVLAFIENARRSWFGGGQE